MKAISHRRASAAGDAPKQAEEMRLIELAQHAQPRGEAALEALLARHRDWILRRCTSWLGNRADAEDVAQEVLLRVCSGIKGLEQHARFRAWLARIVDNQCKSHLARRRWITVEHIERLIDLGETFSPPEDLEGSRRQVRQVLEQLPVDSARVLYLGFFQDLSLEQIAGALDVSLSAAKMRLYRAQDRFASRYAQLQT